MFEWNTQLSVEVKEIDSQHKELLGMVNRTLEMIQSGESGAALHEALDLFCLHVERHFQSEEEYMLRYRYPGRKSHREEHEEIKDCIASFKRAPGREMEAESLYRELKGFMTYYVLKHMVMTDKALGDFLKGRMFS